MSAEMLFEILEDIKNGLKRFLTSRILPFTVIGIGVFAVLLYRIFSLQIVNGEEYSQNYTMKTEKEITTAGTRGRILDKNGILLAYSELAYSVVIEDCGYYSTKSIKNSELNDIVYKMINIIEDHGDKVNVDYSIELKDGEYRFVSDDENTIKRFLRDTYGHSAISQLTKAELDSSPQDVINYVCNKLYDIDQTEYDREMVLKLIYIRTNLSANSYKRYVPFTVASNVSDETMAAILENSDVLTGVTIQQDSIRKYNYSKYIAHIIGYTGKVSPEELTKFQGFDESYNASDIVGKSGIESAFETTLAGKKGSTTMLVDSVGRVLDTKKVVQSETGNDVYLTIDVEYQKKVYDLLERRLAETLVSRIVNSDSSAYGEKDIVIPIKEVYFALFDNNVIDMSKLALAQDEISTNVYQKFTASKASVLANVENEIKGAGTPYNALSEDMKDYISLARKALINDEIINANKVDSEDEISKNWSAGNISLRDYLKGIIEKDWINIYNLSIDSQYPTSDEVLEAIITRLMQLMSDNNDFDKLVYSQLIWNGSVTGREVCLILFEQGILSDDPNSYGALYGGSMNPFDFMVKKINNVEITPAQLALDPCSGAVVVEDPKTGDLKAAVTYPSYDINYFSGTIDSAYYKKLLADKSTPLVNRATQTRIAPGSTFKPLMAVAGLNEGVITPHDTIYCTGIFDTVTPALKCHVYPQKHGSLDTVNALRVSCNYYFCEVGYRLCVDPFGNFSVNQGLNTIKKYAEELGLATKSGLQISESSPQASNSNVIASSIGQGTNAYSAVNLARYISTVANSGTVYNSSIVSKIVDSKGTTVKQYDPEVANTVNVDPSVWGIVHTGMKEVIEEGIMNPLTSTLPADVAGKSGTAQENLKRGDHANYVMFSSVDDADVVVAVMIPNGYAATNAGIMAYYALASYYGTEIPEHVYFTLNSSLEY